MKTENSAFTIGAKAPVMIAAQENLDNAIERDGKLFRVAQDGTFGYGSGLSIVEVTQLSTERVEQVVRNKVWPGSPHWPGKRLHTLARAGNLECIDGEGLAARAGWLRSLLRWPVARRCI